MIPKYEMDLIEKEFGNLEKPTEAFIDSIKIKGFKLKRDEKEELAFKILNFGLDMSNEDAMIKSLLISRKLEKEMQEEIKKWEKQQKAFVKEWRRLSIKYNYFTEEEKNSPLEDFIEKWDNDYYEIGFMWEYRDSIEYYGGKKYAQYYCATRGICPDSEVEMWK